MRSNANVLCLHLHRHVALRMFETYRHDLSLLGRRSYQVSAFNTRQIRDSQVQRVQMQRSSGGKRRQREEAMPETNHQTRQAAAPFRNKVDSCNGDPPCRYRDRKKKTTHHTRPVALFRLERWLKGLNRSPKGIATALASASPPALGPDMGLGQDSFTLECSAGRS